MTSVVRTALSLNRSFQRVTLRTSPRLECSPFRWTHSTRGLRLPSARDFSLSAASEQAEEVVHPPAELPSPSALDIRVGKILSCELHPDAESLFVEQIEIGEEEPRTICSGLVPYLATEDLLNASVVVLCNLKARNLRGVKSHGMLLCASDKENSKVFPLIPPQDASIGDKITFGESESAPETENRMKKAKIWDKLQPLMKTDGEGIATCNGVPMMVTSGPVTCTALIHAPIS